MRDRVSESVEPKLVSRACGGWLALTPDDMALKFGVCAPTEGAARKAFARSLAAWDKLGEEGGAHA